MTEPDDNSVVADLKAAREAKAASNAVPADMQEATQQLGALLGLPSVGLEVRGARVVGRGGKASADLYLSDGSTIAFDSMRDVGTANRLVLEVAACTGATPKLNPPAALRAVTLIRAIAQHEQVFTGDDIAREWGIEYLADVDIIDVDLSDQRDRWGAFLKLSETHPSKARRNRESDSVAEGSIVLRNTDGTRLVRAGWFAEHVREQEVISPTEIAHRMERVGWRRRGATGRIKATRPGHRGQLGWNFHIVAAGWENAK